MSNIERYEPVSKTEPQVSGADASEPIEFIDEQWHFRMPPKTDERQTVQDKPYLVRIVGDIANRSEVISSSIPSIIVGDTLSTEEPSLEIPSEVIPESVTKPDVRRSKTTISSSVEATMILAELFAAADVARTQRDAQKAEQVTELVRQIQETREAAKKQRGIDRQKAADKQQSDERAEAFVGIMREHKISPVKVYKAWHEYLRTETHPSRSQGKELYPEYKSHIYKITYTLYGTGKGWIIKDTTSESKNPTRLVLCEDVLTTFIFDGKRDKNYDIVPFEKAVAIAQDYSHDAPAKQNYSTIPPLESPYAGEEGRALLGQALLRYGIVSGSVSTETAE